MGAQTAPSQREVSFDHQHMIHEAFITFHLEGLALRHSDLSFVLLNKGWRCLYKLILDTCANKKFLFYNLKLEDLKVLRRSPDPLNYVKIGQGQLQLIMV